MSRIIVEYNPNLSAIGARAIEDNVTPSMSSIDGSSNQYEISIVRECLIESNLTSDLTLVEHLINDGVDFIEF